MKPPANPAHTPQEVEHAVAALMEVDRAKFLRIAQFQVAWCPGLRAEDLLYDTALRFLDGRRSWPQGYGFPTVFFGALVSVADELREDENARRALISNESELLPVDGESPSLPEERTSDGSPAAEHARDVVEALYLEFKDDDNVQAVLMGWAEDKTGREIQKEWGMSATQYDTARKSIERWRAKQKARR